jgi:hypothetical protein
MELLFSYATGELGVDKDRVAEGLWRDYQRGGRRDKPAFLKNFLPVSDPTALQPEVRSALPKRQARHGLAIAPNDANIVS